MTKKREGARREKGALNAEQAEKLFATVDETGHTNEETARKERRHREQAGQGVDIDPLSQADPSGSNVGTTITRTAIGFVIVILLVVVLGQVSCAAARRASTANLSEDVSVSTVASALEGGVEWGNGFTQFPEDFQVVEADENTHRIEVTVTDTTSTNELEVFSGSQIQATALAVNSLLNPNINTVIYHVNVHEDENGKIQTSSLFGFLKPTGETKTLMTFIWTKTNTTSGVKFNCTITGIDSTMQKKLHDSITSSFTPSEIISSVLGSSDSSDSSSSDDDLIVDRTTTSSSDEADSSATSASSAGSDSADSSSAGK